MDTEISQTLADSLLAMEKRCISPETLFFPNLGDKVTIELASFDTKEEFLLDVNRTSLVVKHCTLQNRARKTIILARLCTSKGHRNPDGEEVPAPHLHLYRQGYADKFAYPLPKTHFTNIDDLYATYDEFMNFCNVVEKPRIVWQPDLLKEEGV